MMVAPRVLNAIPVRVFPPPTAQVARIARPELGGPARDELELPLHRKRVVGHERVVVEPLAHEGTTPVAAARPPGVELAMPTIARAAAITAKRTTGLRNTLPPFIGCALPMPAGSRPRNGFAVNRGLRIPYGISRHYTAFLAHRHSCSRSSTPRARHHTRVSTGRGSGRYLRVGRRRPDPARASWSARSYFR